jgi:CBS domain containing-hemolysin-like protein
VETYHIILLVVGILLLVVDFIITMIKSSLTYLFPHQLIAREDEIGSDIQPTVALINQPHFQPTLYLTQVFIHMVLVIVTMLIAFELLSFSGWLAILLVAGVFLLVLIVEFALQGLVFEDLENYAIRFTPLARIVTVLMRPFSAFFMSFMGPLENVSSVLGSDFEDELKSWALDDREEEEIMGDLEQDERKMVYSIFQLSDTLCREIMVPRIEVFSLEETMHLVEAARLATESGHSRVPIYHSHIDNVTGILYVKDMLKVILENGDNELPPLKSLLRPTYFVPESKKVTDLLQEMRAKEVHLAVVVDEYGGTAGLVTMEDIVEEIVGEIRDEYDQAEELPFEQVGDGEFIFQGRIDLDDFNEYMGTELDANEADTLGGFLYYVLGRVPSAGEVVELEQDHVILTVRQVVGRRITKVHAIKLPNGGSEEANGQDEHGKRDTTSAD